MIKGLKVRSERLLLTFSLNVERNPTTHSHTLMQNARVFMIYHLILICWRFFFYCVRYISAVDLTTTTMTTQ